MHPENISGWRETVSDTGVGIAPEDQEAVFEEFRQVGTADKRVEGTGLGLTLCQKFVELHGGRIWVKSAGCGFDVHVHDSGAHHVKKIRLIGRSPSSRPPPAPANMSSPSRGTSWSRS